MIAAVVLSVLAGVVAAVLLLPISVVARGAAGEDELWGVAELRWAFRAAAVQLSSESGARVLLLGVPVYRLRLRRGEKKPKRKRARKERKPKKATEGRSLVQTLGPDRRAAMGMLTRGIGALHPSLYVGGTVGLGAPDKTALMLTAVQQLNAMTPERIEIDLHDDYLTDFTQLSGRLRAWVVPAELGLVFLGWLIRSDTRRVLRRVAA